ncbi:restriction endonuclease subunit S [Gallibacterium anatis]|uniref:Restriction endonuclease subunit S n=1 Tax=Gallibacterium anatis TaxID=750 RepID=A0AAX3XCV2_9PAST|nr:restriction endonuclease subunit S [Gallibacterium anatis]MDK9430301.1 restriction endonuclease subunit S [Gallibacterium anatis]WIM79862.1 restriction endonuclease subunit S [Gallibacterium anatis]
MKNFVEASTFCHLVTDGTHNSPKKTNDGVLLVTSKNITNGKLDLSKSYYISKDDAIEINKRSKVNKFDILISMIGTVGEVCFIDQEPNFVVKNVGILKNKDKFHAKWLYFYLKSQEAQNIIKERLNGTTQQYLSLGELRKLPILKPISENHLINTVEILDNFEKKITLNTQTNQTLEQIAQAIFKHWFIDFAPVHAKANALARGETIEQAELAAMACLSGKTAEKITALKTQDPTAYHQLQQTAAAFPSEFVETEMGLVPKGWEVKKIDEVIQKIPVGKKYSQKTTVPDGKIPVLDQGKSGIIGFHNDTAGVNASIQDPVIVFANHTCYMRLIHFDFSAIQNVFAFKGQSINIYWLYLATLGKQTFVEYKGHFPDFLIKQIVVPPKELTEIFGNLVQNSFSKIALNLENNAILAKTRDLLLPKLLNGEVEL